jgi:hypothetical protein
LCREICGENKSGIFKDSAQQIDEGFLCRSPTIARRQKLTGAVRLALLGLFALCEARSDSQQRETTANLLIQLPAISFKMSMDDDDALAGLMSRLAGECAAPAVGRTAEFVLPRGPL